MKRSTIATFLTFFMLWLVLLAAAVFLFQQRQTLRQTTSSLESSLAAREEAISRLDGALSDNQVALATAEATLSDLTGQLTTSQQQVAATQEQLATAEASLSEQAGALATSQATLAQSEAELQQLQEQLPQVMMVTPADGDILPPNQPVAILVAASDLRGVVAVNLTIGDKTLTNDLDGKQTLAVVQENWLPPAEGVYTINVMAVNGDGRASNPVSVTINVFDPAARNAALRAEVETNVIELRGLEPLSPITPTLLTTEELRERLQADLEAEVTPAETQDDVVALSAFDFVEPDFDLYNFTLNLYSEQIAGFYDPETGEFVVISDDHNLDPLEQSTHAHEFVHALQDQYYALELLEDSELDSEAQAALRALAEGDAFLTQLLFEESGYFSEAEQTEISQLRNEAPTEVYDAAPAALQASFVFPYTAGINFVATLYRQGGFAAVDAAWADPPQSTEHILHPDRYLAGDDVPQLVSLTPLTATLGAGWRRVDEDILGEFFLRLYLGQELDEEMVDTAATGWGGDRYAVYWHEAEGNVVMVLRLTWDTAADGEEFTLAYEEYAQAVTGAEGEAQAGGGTCWLGEDVFCLYQVGDDTLVVRAPDLPTAAAVSALQR
ncbi:MAG: Ig-like domain-containing protein [Chloroflexota bacterium]